MLLSLLQAQQAGDGGFKFTHIMIDKSKAEMAACSAEGIKYLLCYFHFLQDWERFLRSASSGVREAKDRHEMICSLRQLKEQRNEAMFKHAVRPEGRCTLFIPYEMVAGVGCAGIRSLLSPAGMVQEDTFLAEMGRRYPSVATQYRANWQGCATHWAEWGRLDILDKNCHTNNLLERFFGNLKYALLGRKTQHSLTELCQKLVEEIAPAYVDRRCYMLAGRGTSTLANYQQRRQLAVRSLLSTPGAIFAPTTAGAAPGQAIICQDGGTIHTTVLGDLSCTCGYSGEQHLHVSNAHYTRVRHHRFSPMSICRVTYLLSSGGCPSLQIIGPFLPLYEGGNSRTDCAEQMDNGCEWALWHLQLPHICQA